MNYNLTQTIKFKTKAQVCAFANFLIANGIADYDALVDIGVLRNLEEEHPYDDDWDYPDVVLLEYLDPDFSLGTYFVWLETGFDRTGNYGFRYFIKVDEPIDASEFLKRATETLKSKPTLERLDALQGLGLT